MTGAYPATYTPTYPGTAPVGLYPGGYPGDYPTTGGLGLSPRVGLGDRLFVAGSNLSGDIGAVDSISGGPATLDVTRLVHSGIARIGGLRDGGIQFTAFYNPAAGRSHERLSALPTADQIVTYCRGAALGNPAAACVAKQLDYAGKRGSDGGFTFGVSAQASGYGLEWGTLLTPGEKTLGTLAASGRAIGSPVDAGAASSFGLQAYLHVTAFTGTDATITLHSSSDGGITDPYAAITGGAFTTVSAVGAQRIATSPTQTVERYLRPVVTTLGGFTALSYVLAVVRNETAVSF